MRRTTHSGPVSFERTRLMISERRSRVTLSIASFVAQQRPSVRDVFLDRLANHPRDGHLFLVRDLFEFAVSLARQAHRCAHGFAFALSGLALRHWGPARTFNGASFYSILPRRQASQSVEDFKGDVCRPEWRSPARGRAWGWFHAAGYGSLTRPTRLHSMQFAAQLGPSAVLLLSN